MVKAAANHDSKARKNAKTRERMKKYRKKLAYRKALCDEIKKRSIQIVTNNHELPNSIHDISDNQSEKTKNSDHDHQMLDFKDQIKCWAVKHCITKRALNDLLSILIIFGFDLLPKDSRTLMQTPVNVHIRELSHGKLWYHGIKKYLEQIFHSIQRDIVTSLDLNFDGVELFNSSKTCFWPMIASIRGIPGVYKQFL